MKQAKRATTTLLFALGEKTFKYNFVLVRLLAGKVWKERPFPKVYSCEILFNFRRFTPAKNLETKIKKNFLAADVKII